MLKIYKFSKETLISVNTFLSTLWNKTIQVRATWQIRKKEEWVCSHHHRRQLTFPHYKTHILTWNELSSLHKCSICNLILELVSGENGIRKCVDVCRTSHLTAKLYIVKLISSISHLISQYLSTLFTFFELFSLLDFK